MANIKDHNAKSKKNIPSATKPVAQVIGYYF